MRRHLVRLPVVLLLMFACATVVWAFSSGPLPSRTSARALGSYPAEANCTQCHSGNAINDPNGALHILGVPAAYAPGYTYPITVQLAYSLSDTTGASNPKWGFELTAVKLSDGTGAGTFQTPAPGDSASHYPDSLQIKTATSGSFLSSGRQYIEHTTFSTRTDQPSPVQWTMYWTAPASDVGQIDFFAAGNAANGDGSSSGDHIFTTAESTVVLVSAPIAAHGTTLELAAPRPNPARNGAAFDYSLPRPASIDLAIFDAQGRRVRTLASGARPAGAASARWDGRSDGGAPAAAGTYFARLRSGDAPPVVRRFTLTR
jgi:FlgD Ig-like domain